MPVRLTFYLVMLSSRTQLSSDWLDPAKKEKGRHDTADWQLFLIDNASRFDDPCLLVASYALALI